MLTERSTRLFTGLILLAYVVCHFAGHATGVLHLEAMDRIGRKILLAPWRTLPGRTILLTALSVHAGLGLWSLLKRRHLRIPAIEGWQLTLGLAIPLLLIPHLVNVRLGYSLFGLADSYFRIVYQYWITTPVWGLSRQFALLTVAWAHGCIGLHMWGRRYPWYQHRLPLIAMSAVVVPALAVLGISSAGGDAVLRSAIDAGFADRYGPAAAGTAGDRAHLAVERLWGVFQLSWIVLVACVLAWRLERDRRAWRAEGVAIAYPDGTSVSVPRGFSLLEASRWAGKPHASICGGRGRCSTCRVRIANGSERLPPASAMELATLERIAAGPGIRLACQVRPTHGVGIEPLVAVAQPAEGLRVEAESGREALITAVFVDLRDSTRLAADRLPFDALFLVDRYVQTVTRAVQRQGGHVTSVAGDGIMSIFGHDCDAALGARRAVKAVEELWTGLDALNRELAGELGAPLRFGVGVHTGLSVIGGLSSGQAHRSLQFLGDTGNVAARLEAATVAMGCAVVLSGAVARTAGLSLGDDTRRETMTVRGREAAPIEVYPVATPAALAAMLTAGDARADAR